MRDAIHYQRPSHLIALKVKASQCPEACVHGRTNDEAIVTSSGGEPCTTTVPVVLKYLTQTVRAIPIGAIDLFTGSRLSSQHSFKLAPQLLAELRVLIMSAFV